MREGKEKAGNVRAGAGSTFLVIIHQVIKVKTFLWNHLQHINIQPHTDSEMGQLLIPPSARTANYRGLLFDGSLGSLLFALLLPVLLPGLLFCFCHCWVSFPGARGEIPSFENVTRFGLMTGCRTRLGLRVGQEFGGRSPCERGASMLRC